MRLHTLAPAKGSHKGRKIVGRGTGSGHGKTSTRGHKGQRSRSGGKSHIPGFEGGQNPIHQRLPKRGFTNIHRVEYAPINLSRIDALEGVTEFTPQIFAELGLTKKKDLIKVLGNGEIKKAVTISAHRFSKTAKEKIESAGGKVVEL